MISEQGRVAFFYMWSTRGVRKCGRVCQAGVWNASLRMGMFSQTSSCILSKHPMQPSPCEGSNKLVLRSFSNAGTAYGCMRFPTRPAVLDCASGPRRCKKFAQEKNGRLELARGCSWAHMMECLTSRLALIRQINMVRKKGSCSLLCCMCGFAGQSMVDQVATTITGPYRSADGLFHGALEWMAEENPRGWGRVGVRSFLL